MAIYWHVGAHVKFRYHAENVSVQVHAVNCGTARKNMVCTLNLALRVVHMHKKVRTVYTHTIRVRRVYAILAEHRGVWLARAQYGYMLSHDS
jgi:hypothetical protein